MRSLGRDYSKEALGIKGCIKQRRQEGMKTKIGKTFGLALMLFIGVFGMLLALGTFDGGSVFAAKVTTVQGEADPTDPNKVAKYTIKFVNEGGTLDGGVDSITVELEDDIQVPDTIDPAYVTITTTRFSNDRPTVTGAATGTVVANPLGVNVVFDGTPKDDPNITLEIGDMEPSTATPGYQGIYGAASNTTGSTTAGSMDYAPTVTIVFRQNAGLVNPTEAEAGFMADGTQKGRDVKVLTSKNGSGAASTQVTATDGNRVIIPRIIELSDNKDKRGKVITVTGRGFSNGTTATIWRDTDADGSRDAGEVDLGSELVASDDTFTFTLTIQNPPFGLTKSENRINAIDGKKNTLNGTATSLPISGGTVTATIPTFTLSTGMTVTPTTAAVGDDVQITLKDAQAVNVSTYGTLKLGGTPVTIPSATVSSAGDVVFNVTIPDATAEGVQQLKLTGSSLLASGGDTSATVNLTISGATLTVTPDSGLVPNQSVTLIGSGFTGSSTIAAAATDDSSMLIDGDHTGLKSAGSSVSTEDLKNINADATVDIDNGGNWSSTVVLPVNDTTTVDGDHELKVTDLGGRSGSVTLSFAPRVFELDPVEARVGTTVDVVGTGFPANNTATGTVSTPTVSIKYTYGSTTDTVATLTPDGSGNITGSFKVPLNASIPSTNSVKAVFSYTPTGTSTALDNTTAVTHKVPKATLAINPEEGAEGSNVTITGEGFKTYSTVSTLKIGAIDVRPAPIPSTDSNGNFSVTVLVPQSTIGSASVTATVASTTATDTFTVLDAAVAPAVTETPAVALAALISEGDNLERVWHFDAATQNDGPDYGWSLYDPRPAFADANTVTEMSDGNFYWIKVTNAQTAVLGGSSRVLYAGWNPVTW